MQKWKKIVTHSDDFWDKYFAPLFCVGARTLYVCKAPAGGGQGSEYVKTGIGHVIFSEIAVFGKLLNANMMDTEETMKS